MYYCLDNDFEYKDSYAYFIFISFTTTTRVPRKLGKCLDE